MTGPAAPQHPDLGRRTPGSDVTDGAGHDGFRARLRGWLSAHAPPRSSPDAPAAAWAGREPRQWAAALHAAGYSGLTWPVEAGGAGLDASYEAVLAEECARAGVPEHPNVIGLHMVGPTLSRCGSEPQRSRHLPRILSGEHLFCQGFSEPEAGSDLAAVRTRAEAAPDGDGWVVTGEKLWSSYAGVADFCLLLVRTGSGTARHDGLTVVILDMAAPGVRVRPLPLLTGDATFGQIVLDGVRVPADAAVGPVGGGWTVAMTTLAHERGTFAATLTARLQIQLDRLATTVRVAGLAADPVTRTGFADVAVDVAAARSAARRVSGAGRPPGPEAAMLKLSWADAHQRLVAFAGDVCAQGRPGALLDEWRAYWQRERLRSRGNSIEGGTSEVLRGLVAERCAGLPRSR